MLIDPKIEEAIEEAVAESGQSEALAHRLVAWFKAIASGSEQIHNKQSADLHLELLYDATETDGNQSDTEEDV